MRIGVNTLFYIPGDVGGSETYLRGTLRPMIEGFPQHFFILYTNMENDPVLRRDLGDLRNVDFLPIAFRAANRYARIIREQVQLPFLVRQSSADVLWSPGYTAPFFSPCPQVVTIHDMQYKRYPDDLSWLARVATEILLTGARRSCAHFLVPSSFSKDEVRRFLGIQDEQMTVTHEGVDSFWAQAGDDLASGEGASIVRDGSRPFILSVANTYPHKNIDALVTAFGRIAEEMPHDLVIVGRPRRGEKALQGAIRRLVDPCRCKRIEYLSRTDLRFLMRHADVFAFPSLYEGFGLPVLEAMMAGCLVAASARASIPEVGGVHALYFDPDKNEDIARGLKEALSLPRSMREERVRGAQQWAAAFSWDGTARLTVATLEKVARDGASPTCAGY